MIDGGIILKEVAEASVATPAAGKVTVFFNPTGELKKKDETGTVGTP